MPQLRLVTLLGSLALPFLVLRLTAMHWPQEAPRRTLQWFFMPRLFPLYFPISGCRPTASGAITYSEQRYYLPPFTLFQAWRAPIGARWENALLALYALGTILIMWGIVSERFFP